MIEAEFHALEDCRGDEAPRHVERKHGRVVARVLCREADDPFLVEHVFHVEPGAGSDECREQDVSQASVDACGEILRADVGERGDVGENSVEQDELHLS